MHCVLLHLALFVTTALPCAALAQGAGGPPITLGVHYPAGGPSDAGARRIAPELERELGQPVLVQNVSGATGAIATQKVVAAVRSGDVGDPIADPHNSAAGLWARARPGQRPGGPRLKPSLSVGLAAWYGAAA